MLSNIYKWYVNFCTETLKLHTLNIEKHIIKKLSPYILEYTY
jgi:hypothetical protein